MSKYEIGYKKPPKHTQFKKGVCPNPRGRGKRSEPIEFGEIIKKVLHEKIEFCKKGVRRKASRLELAIRQLVSKAANGDLDSAATLLKLRAHAAKDPLETNCMVITVHGGLPDPLPNDDTTLVSSYRSGMRL
jgi:hypothetical protein